MSPRPLLRFAPSPTGLLHAGNARIALLNRLRAEQTGAAFLLRLDDTDETRSTPAFARAIEKDLAWLGIAWDQSFRQSERLARYAEAQAALTPKPSASTLATKRPKSWRRSAAQPSGANSPSSTTAAPSSSHRATAAA